MSHAISRQPADLAGLPWSHDRETILACYLELLAQAGSPLLRAGHDVVTQVKAQLYGVIDAVRATLEPSAVDPNTPTAGGAPSLSEDIGRTRATTGIHPSQSLQAAALIFEAALPTLTRRATALGDPDAQLTVGVRLNREILTRMAIAARAYVDYLLDKAYNTNRDERRRLSRELHDVAAPAVAIGLQNLELFDVYVSTDPERAGSKIDAARQALLDALSTIRNLSAESRESVAANGLDEAIRRYLDTLPSEVRAQLTSDGDLSLVSLAYAEELFLIIREAVRNAVDHGQPHDVLVTVVSTPDELRAEITDNGQGFDVVSILEGTRHVGIDSMHERAELLGARLSVTSAPGNGTTVGVRISLPTSNPTPAGQAAP